MNYPTPTTIEALELAIELLEAIRDGRAYARLDFLDRLQRLHDARDEHYRTVMKEDRARAQLRELGRLTRERKHG